MNWEYHVKQLSKGNSVSFKPRGNSMTPRINSGDLILISPWKKGDVEKGDIVFCRVKGNYYVHLIKATKGDRFLIGNNRGKLNGWINKRQIFGKVTKVED